jgi:6-phosphogluconolactonase (cycloisomerase 2 family)
MVGSKRFVFVGLERADAVAVYDITDMSNITFKQFLKTTGDDAPEGILFVSATDSPSGNPLLVVSNEDSGNVTVYRSDANGVFSFASRLVLEGGAAAAEISAYDPTTKRLFVLITAPC